MENHSSEIPLSSKIAEILLQSKTGPLWEKIGVFPRHGLSVPLFSLRSKTSCGIGEFLDLIPLIDWCQKLGFHLIQTLPLNDTGDDPSPYNALSAHAMDPVFISLSQLDNISPDLEKRLSSFSPLEQGKWIAYAEVKRKKLQWLYDYFVEKFSTLSKTADYQEFIEKSLWLQPYALFKAIKDEYGGKSWQLWPKELQEINKDTLFSYYDQFSSKMEFHFFLQYLCHDQMRKVKQRAKERNILLKGDVPILISADSVDVWLEKDLFILDLVAGAPPDLYNAHGQKWGFPLFNWEKNRSALFSWWKQRIQTLSQYFDLFRIDHVVGFFRIWAMTINGEPSEGFFVPENRHLWEKQGREFLEMVINASSMLPLAEDLGTIPKEVFSTLKEFGICGTRITRWQRYWEESAGYILPENYDPISLTTVSTHDLEPLTLWWEKSPKEAELYAKWKNRPYTPHLTEEMRIELLKDSHATTSLFHVNPLQEYLAFFPEWVSKNPEDEQINKPGTQVPTNWTYRYTPLVEEITTSSPLFTLIRKLIPS